MGVYSRIVHEYGGRKKAQNTETANNVIVVNVDGQGDTGSAEEPKKKNRGIKSMLIY